MMSYVQDNDWSARALLWRHFRQPVGAEPLEAASTTAETFDSSRSQQLRLEILYNGQHIHQAAFKAFGGVVLLACGSWLCEWLAGRSAAELEQLKPGQLVEQLTAQLELQPAEKPTAFLAEDIVPLLLAAINVDKS